MVALLEEAVLADASPSGSGLLEDAPHARDLVGQHAEARPGRGELRGPLEQVREQLSRTAHPYPTLEIAPRDSIDDYEYEDFSVVGYEHHPAIAATVAV